MKDKSLIIIMNIVLITVAVALAIFLAVLQISNKNKSSNQNLENGFEFTVEDIKVNIDETLMSEYISSSLGIKLKYYNEFTRVTEVTEKDAMYKSAAMYREEGNEGINVLIGNVSEGIIFDSYINATVTAIMESNSLTKEDITVIKDGVKLGNMDAFKVRYKMDDINIYQICTIKDSKEYVVTYSAEDLYYDKQKADNMFSTFEFIN